MHCLLLSKDTRQNVLCPKPKRKFLLWVTLILSFMTCFPSFLPQVFKVLLLNCAVICHAVPDSKLGVSTKLIWCSPAFCANMVKWQELPRLDNPKQGSWAPQIVVLVQFLHRCCCSLPASQFWGYFLWYRWWFLVSYTNPNWELLHILCWENNLNNTDENLI